MHSTAHHTELQRPRLVRKLQEAAQRSLTIVTAPPGYGKTTAVAQFADASTCPVAWHRLEPHERDLTSLFSHSLSVLEAVCPGIAHLQPVGTPDEMAAHTASYLAETLPSDVIYVLDDAHLLESSPATHRWLRTLLQRLPKHCHLVLISRTLPDVPLHDLLARHEVMRLDQDDLRLTAEETRALAALCGQPLNDRQLADLQRRLEGWPAGTLLRFQSTLDGLLPSQETLTGETLFDVLAGAMLDAQPAELRRFLLRSATLGWVSPDLCQAILGIADGATYLDEIQRRSLFVFRGRQGLVYHSLLRTYLQERLRGEAPETFQQLHARAAAYFDQADAPDEAFEHYLAAGQIEQAVVLTERTATAYLIQGRTLTLLDWADRLAQVGALSPNLLSCCVNIDTVQFQFEQAEARLHVLENLFKERADTANLGNVRLQRAALRQQQGRYAEAAAYATALLQAEPPIEGIRARALYILGNAQMFLGETRGAVSCFEEALSRDRGRTDAYSLSQLLQSLGMAYSRLGNLQGAVDCLQEVVSLRRELGGASALAYALNNLGFYYHSQGDYDLALTTLEEGLRLLSSVPENRTEAHLLWSLGSLKRDLGLFEEADPCYRRALDLLGEAEAAVRCAVLTDQSIAQRWQGQLKEARAIAERAVAIADAQPIQPEGSLARAALWAVRARTGAVDEAIQALDGLHADLKQRSARIKLVWLLGLSAEAALLKDNLNQASRLLRLADKLGREVGTLQVLAAEIVASPALSALLEQSGRQLVTLKRAVQVLHAARSRYITPSVTDHTPRGLPYHLRIASLGQERILRDGEHIPTSAWRSANARELFLYLLFEGPTSREHLCLTLWPDSSAARVRSNFHTLLYHARLALGAAAILAQDGLYLLNPELDIWCDALAFERLVKQARLLSPHDALLEDRWQRATELYRGEFLSELDREWVVVYREKLQELFLEALIGLGECQRRRHDYSAALETFRRALALDPLREETHRALLRCYAEQGDKYRVAFHMRQLEARLNQELGVGPSEETLHLARSLLA